MVPFIALNTFLIILYLIGGLVLGLAAYMDSFPGLTWIQRVFYQLLVELNSPTSLGGACWFLLVLFGASLLVKLVSVGIDYWDLHPFLGLLPLSLLVWWMTDLHARGQRLPYEIDLWPLAALFIYLGMLSRKGALFESLRKTFWIEI